MPPLLPPALRRGLRLHAVVLFCVAGLLAAVRPLAAQAPFANGQLAVTVLGSASFRDFVNSTTLSHPTAVAVDETSGKVYVADMGNNRVLRYGSLAALQSGQAAERVFGQANFGGTLANWNRGTPDAATLRDPQGVAVDAAGRLYVVDTGNHRVLRFDAAATGTTNGPDADRVFGQDDFTSKSLNRGGVPGAGTMNNPRGVAVDAAGRLYVVDTGNHRVLRFDAAATGTTNGPEADRVFGQDDFTGAGVNRGGSPGAGTLWNPYGVAVDAAGRLYVADVGNHRVLRFDAAATGTTNGPDADRVFGQGDFTSGSNNRGGGLVPGAGTLSSPAGVAVDGAGRLYVADQANHRVLRFDDAATGTTSGPDADRVLGQVSVTGRGANRGGSTGPATLSSPTGLAVDGTGRLYVADQANHRVLRFDDAATGTTSGPDADRVLGHASLTNGQINGKEPGAMTLWGPRAVAVDETSGKVYVADSRYHRVLRYGSLAALQSSQAAERVFGQANFTDVSANRGGAVGAGTLSSPAGVAVDGAGRLYVADAFNKRVLRFDDAATGTTNGPDADRVFGQGDFTSGSSNGGGAVGAGTLSSPAGVAVDGAGRLYVADAANHRVLRFDDAATGTTNGPDAERVFGQADFGGNAANRGGNAGAGTLNNPYGVAVDGAGRLYVADAFNNRVLRFDDAATGTTNGPNADRVFGQGDFSSVSADRGGGPGAGTMEGAQGVAVDGAGRLYVVDTSNHRVLRFDDAGTGTTNGPDASGMLGQFRLTDVYANRGVGRGPGGLHAPMGVAVDNATGQLFVADFFNERVLVYKSTTGYLPVELVAFSAASAGRSARLTWTTASETNNAGFTVERQSGGVWTSASGLIAGHGTTTERRDYSFEVSGLTAGRHTFRLRQTDTDGSVHHSAPLTVEIGVQGGLVLTPLGVRGVRVEADGAALVTVVDVLGRAVRTVRVEAGTSEVRLDAVAAGVYLVRAEVAGGRTATTRLVVR